MACRATLTCLAVLTTLLTATACAPQLTPRQVVTWDAFKECQAEGPSAKLEQLKVDGTWLVVGRGVEVQRVHACMLAYRDKAILEGRWPAVPASVTINLAPARPAGLIVPEAPMWSAGDEWRFSTSSIAGRQTKYTWRVDREQPVDGVPCYVIKSGTRELFYRKPDLAQSHETFKGDIWVRNTPPRLTFVWPLSAGTTWHQTYRYERPSDKQSYDTSYSATVEGEETVTVPAGTFKTLKIVYRDKANKKLLWEQWYSADVRMWVKVHEPALQEGTRTRELLSFTPAGKKAEADRP